MRAVRFDHYGDVDVLHVEDVPQPSAPQGGLVVQVAASSINPGEIAIREGAMDEQFPSTFPSGQGSDFAGRIHALGDGVTAWQVGDEVIGWTDNRDAQAEYVVVPANQVTTRPPTTPVEQAACLHVAGCTAYAFTTVLQPQAGETVVVTGAAGGVGCATVQLLRRLDVRVIGVAGPDNDDYLRSLGAEPINYGDGLGHRLREATPDGIDAVADAFGDGYVQLATGLGVAAERIATIIDFDTAQRLGTRVVMGDDVASPAVLAELAEHVADGELTFPIAAVYPMNRVQDAYTELAERHTRGKIVLDIA